jgi:CspA family cold shock protein
MKEQGTAKWFNSEQAHGFMSRPSGEDVFVHHSALSITGPRSLDEGESIEFGVVKEPKGLQARNVVVL